MIPGVIPNSGAPRHSTTFYYYPHCTVAWRSLDHVENRVVVPVRVVFFAEESILWVALKDLAILLISVALYAVY